MVREANTQATCVAGSPAAAARRAQTLNLAFVSETGYTSLVSLNSLRWNILWPAAKPIRGTFSGVSGSSDCCQGRHVHCLGSYSSVTMDDIAAGTGDEQKTLYAHFRSKPELVEAIMLRSSRKSASAPVAERWSDFPIAARELLACVQAPRRRDSTVVRARRAKTAPELFLKIEGRRRALIQRYFGKLFANGRKQECSARTSRELAIEMLLSAIRAIANPQKLMELGLTPTEVIPAIISVILEGVLTPAGRAKP